MILRKVKIAVLFAKGQRVLMIFELFKRENKKLIPAMEYDKIKFFIKKKYKIGVYAME